MTQAATGPSAGPRPRPTMAVRREVVGPHVRLGALWFVVVLAAALAAAIALGIVFSLAAGLAAAQVVRLRTSPRTSRGQGRSDADEPRGVVARAAAARASLVEVLGDLHRLTAALGAAALPLAAAASPDTLTAAFAATVVVTLVISLLAAPPASARRGARLTRASVVVVAALAMGGAGAGVVLVRAEGVAAAIILLLLVSVFEAGDFLVGTGSSTAWEGPVAGVAAVVVVALGASLLALAPLGRGGPLVLAGVVAIGAPLGPPLTSVLLGGGRVPARYARRLDALLVVGPLGAWAAAAMAS